MNINNAHLVIGGGGMIGGALAQSLNLAGINVIASDIWKDNLTTHKIHLDLSADADSWVLPRNIDTAYLCSGRTKLDECRMDPAGTSRVNVAGTIRLIDELIKKNVFVVFLSSNQVFDGKVSKVNPYHPQNPKNEYGRQKTSVEKYLEQFLDQAAIVRLTKVVGPGSIFHKWSQALKKNETIRPFSDMMVSPIPLSTVVAILSKIGKNRLCGIWQISGELDVSYAQAVDWGVKVLGIERNLIAPWTTKDAGLSIETNPINTTMDTEAIETKIGVTVPPVKSTVEKVFASNH